MRIQTEVLERHVTDTVKEWQMKLGTADTEMRLFYPKESLAELLGLTGNYEEPALRGALETFCTAVLPKLGEVTVSGQERICLTIPPQGCAYVRQLPDPPFLQDLLKVITHPQSGMEQVRSLFARYAEAAGDQVCEQADDHEGVGTVFYFEKASVDPYVYCVTQDDFGLAYHRFHRRDYAHLKETN